MEAIVITWRELLIGALAIITVCVVEILLFTRFSNRGERKLRGPSAEESRALRGIHAELARLRDQLAVLQKEFAQLKREQQAGTPYSQAIQMAQQGLDAREVAAGCGISRGEAELIIALYRNHPSRFNR